MPPSWVHLGDVERDGSAAPSHGCEGTPVVTLSPVPSLGAGLLCVLCTPGHLYPLWAPSTNVLFPPLSPVVSPVQA